MFSPEDQQRYRTLFISDTHLGMRTSQAESLLDMLRHVEADAIYLVGDIVDFWKVRRGAYWPQPHNDVVQKLLRAVRKGTRLIYVPGNHDEALRQYCGQSFGGIQLQRDAIHTTADGRHYLVLHGDEFDIVVRSAKWLALIGDLGYELALRMNAPVNWVRRRFGFPFWSLSAFLKYNVKQAVSFIGAFEEAVVTEAGRRNVDGVICGHIHSANDRHIENVHYLNCGDWVESCTAIAENDDGSFEVIHWQDVMARRSRSSTIAQALEAA